VRRHRPPRPPAPGTNVIVHLLIGDGRAPLISAEVGHALDAEVLYLRLQLDDAPRSGTRHALDVSISGPPADVAGLVADLAAAVEQATSDPEGGESQ
jgi:hypothetical protein